jgi:uncharacterized protein YecE (DUF72 family)
MDAQFYLGCAVWAYNGWVGDFYPKGSRSTEFLHLYSDRFTTVEVNSTFYVIPDRQTVERWAKETPTGFRFCPKFPKHFTHSGLLLPHIEQALQFLDLMSSRPSSVNQLVQFMSLTGVYWADKPYILPVKRRLTLY